MRKDYETPWMELLHITVQDVMVVSEGAEGPVEGGGNGDGGFDLPEDEF